MTINEAIKQSGTSLPFTGKIIKLAESKMQENENIKYAMIANVLSEAVHGKLSPENVNFKDHLKNKVTGVLVITENRVFFCGGLIFKEIKIDDIKSVDSAKAPFAGNGQIRVQSNTDMIVFDVKCKKVDEVENIISDLRSKGASVSDTSSDSYDELRKLKSLLDEGIISNEDFEQKKKMLLGL